MRRSQETKPLSWCRSRRGLGRLPGALAAAVCLVSAPASALKLADGEPANSFKVSVVANGLSEPTDMAELPDGRVVITQRLGDVVVVTTDGDQIESGHIQVYPEFGEQGLLGVVADPDFATNHTLYFFASAEPTDGDANNKHKVYRIALGDDGKLDSARDTVIDKGLRASRAPNGISNHNGGGLIIYKGQLYVSVGDTGHNKTPPDNHLATCLNWPNGKILRVNLDGSIPDDNPLSNESMVTGCTDWDQPLTMQPPDKRIFAWGLRNPYRFWIDPQTGRMWIGDVGEATREEVSVGSSIDAGGDGRQGENYGWPFAEGTTQYTKQQQSFQPDGTCMGITPARACIPPVYDYPHSQGNTCIIGGLIPDGCGWQAPWNQRYFFGDNGSGRIWTLDVNENRDGVVANSVKDFASSQGIGSFRMGATGSLYLAEVSGGVVDRVTPMDLDPTQCPPGSGGMGAGGEANGGMAGGSTGTGGVDTSGGSAGTSAGGAGAMSGGGNGATGGTNMSAGGALATGGISATGGTGTGATGGAGATGGGTGGTISPAGGSATTGTPGTGTAGAKAGGGNDKSGCGCRVGGGGSGAGGLLALAGVLGLIGLRRRR